MVRHASQNYQGIDLYTVMIIAGFSILFYACMCTANWYSGYNPDKQKFQEYVADIGLSTGINMPAIYQLQIPKYRKPNSPKNTHMV